MRSNVPLIAHVSSIGTRLYSMEASTLMLSILVDILYALADGLVSRLLIKWPIVITINSLEPLIKLIKQLAIVRLTLCSKKIIIIITLTIIKKKKIVKSHIKYTLSVRRGIVYLCIVSVYCNWILPIHRFCRGYRLIDPFPID